MNDLSVISVLWIGMKSNLYLIFQFLVGRISVEWRFRHFVRGRHALRHILTKAPVPFLRLHVTCCLSVVTFCFYFPVMADVVCGTLSALASARLFRAGLSGSPSFSCVGRCCRVRRGAVLPWTWAFIPAWAEASSRRVCANGTQTLIRESVTIFFFFFCQLS